MKIAQNTSLVMRVPSSYRTHRSGVVGCCMEQYNPLALQTASTHSGQFNTTGLALDMTKERIRKMFNNVELSVSSYDTAWVAMVPSPNSPKSPCFPECVNWLMDNQTNDGSWGLLNNNPPLIKDTLSSTLACIVALKRWNVGEDQINKGLSFIESNFSSATDKNQASPSGFDIIFPHMLQHAIDMNINLPLKQSDLSVMLHERQITLNRSDLKEREAYMAYISEGLGDFHDWNIVKKYQMNNGSLFNSPSATAAAVIHHQNRGCLNYLHSLLKKFGNAVPTVYPLDLYVRLSMVDTLERLDITRHFQEEIQNVLDETYRCWMEKDEQIFMDVVTCALAFRLLRTKGYEVSSGSLFEVTKGEFCMNSHDQETLKDVYESLAMYQASQIEYQEESSFNEQKLRLADFKTKLYTASNNRLSTFIQKEVNNALTFPFNARFEGLFFKRNIESYNADYTRTLKTTYRSPNISNNDYLMLAVEDFSESQPIFRRELKYLERCVSQVIDSLSRTLQLWVVEHKIDKLKFARQKQIYALFTASSTFSSPELSDARITWAKTCVLVTVIDDFFDVGGSPEELDNLIQCVEKWNVNVDTDCCSEAVRILFVALKDAVWWVGDKGLKWQERDIKSHLIETWLDMMKSMLKEAIWARDGLVPTIDKYIKASLVSFGLGPTVLQSLYFVGPKLTEEIVQSSEYINLFELLSTHGRLMNDTRTIYKENSKGQLNAVTLHKNYGKSAIEDAEVIEEIKMWSKDQERKLLKLVLEEKGSIVPRACKDPFWKMCNVVNTFYTNDDGFTGHAILNVAHEIINEPLRIPPVAAYDE